MRGVCDQEEGQNGADMAFVSCHCKVVYVETPQNCKKGSPGVDSHISMTRSQRRGAHNPLKVDNGSMRRAELRMVFGSAVGGGRGRWVRMPV